MAKYDYRTHKEGSEEYKGIKEVPVPETAGYPNDIPSTQTEKVRGTGAQTKATKSSSKLG
jgi:hypothetical protein